MCRVSQTKFLLDKYIAGLCFYRTAEFPAQFPIGGAKAEANSADACPGCRDATLAPKAAHSGSQVATTLEREEPPTAGWLHLQGMVS